MTHTSFAAIDRRSPRLISAIAALAVSALPAPVVAAESAGARAFLADIYRHYPIAETPHPYEPTGAEGPKVFTPALLALIRRDQKLAKGEVGALDGDPFCDCQDDGGLKVKIGAVDQTGPSSARAVVTLTFASNSPPDIRRLVILLSRVQSGWRVADIQSSSDPSLSAYLARSNRQAAAGR